MKIQFTIVEDSEIVLTNDKINFFGPDAILKNCTIKSKCSTQSLNTLGMHMYGGSFIQESILSNMHFEEAIFVDVLFKGTFEGCDFGDWDEPERSSVSHCDFSVCILDGVRFLNTDISNLKLPLWPTFIIENPYQVRMPTASESWPKELKITINVALDEDKECSAIVFNGARVAKNNNLTLDELRELISTIENLKIY
jgi:hypothetical protein